MKEQSAGYTSNRDFTRKQETHDALDDPMQDRHQRFLGSQPGALVSRAMTNRPSWQLDATSPQESSSLPGTVTIPGPSLVPTREVTGRPVNRSPLKTWTLEDEDLLTVLTRFVSRLAPRWFSPDQREELFQETCLRLTHIGQDLVDGRPREFSSSFLWQTTTYVRNEQIRQLVKCRNEILFSDFSKSESGDEALKPFDPPTNAFDPQAKAEGIEIGHTIRACLRELSESQRQAVTLRLMGFSYREIAQRFEWTESNADNHISRGLKKLRKLLEDKESL